MSFKPLWSGFPVGSQCLRSEGLDGTTYARRVLPTTAARRIRGACPRGRPAAGEGRGSLTLCVVESVGRVLQT